MISTAKSAAKIDIDDIKRVIFSPLKLAAALCFFGAAATVFLLMVELFGLISRLAGEIDTEFLEGIDIHL